MRYFLILLIFFSQLFMPVYAMELKIENKVSYQIKVASTQHDKQKGLMFVKQMPLNQGMLFDFREDENVAMWMKNTRISLDLIFIDCDYKISDIYKNAKPFSLTKITSASDFCYVLEVNGGEVTSHHIAIGDSVFLLQ